MAEKKQKAAESPETVEKKKEFLESAIPKKGKKNEEKPPAYLLAMLIILGLLVGVAATITLLKPAADNGGAQPDQNQTINDSNYRLVPVTVVYSAECKSCRQTTTIEELFKVRQIAYSLKKVEAKSAEGKQIIGKFGIDRVPTAIVDSEKVAFYPKTKSDFDLEVKKGSLDKIGSAYIIPEQNWNSNFYYPLYYLEKVPGFCEAGKPTIVQFDDYYAPEYTFGRKIFYDFLSDFNATTDVKFSYTQTANSTDNNSVTGNLFLMCASQQGKYIELEHSMTGVYCNNPFSGDPTIVTEPEVLGCRSISNHYGTPLTPVELDIASNRAGMDSNSLKSCFDNRAFYYNQAEKTAKDLHISRPGTFLIDCVETTSIEHLKDSFCEIHPEISACAADANATK
ncbi:MAG TPA: hypothetical protein VJH23_01270 [archaeon]|nr:hypothetical protein [archaeon]